MNKYYLKIYHLGRKTVGKGIDTQAYLEVSKLVVSW